MSLPPGAMGWSAVCNCGFSWPYSLTSSSIQRVNQSQKFELFLKQIIVLRSEHLVMKDESLTIGLDKQKKSA